MTTRKPNVYCAWHPRRGWCFDTITQVGDTYAPDDDAAKKLAFDTLCMILDRNLEFSPNHFLKLGWQIKPACLIDPAELDRLEAVEKRWWEFQSKYKPRSDCCDSGVDTDTMICGSCHDHCGIIWMEE